MKLGTECLSVPGYYSWNAKGTCFCNSLRSASITFPEPKSDFASKAMFQGLLTHYLSALRQMGAIFEIHMAFLTARSI